MIKPVGISLSSEIIDELDRIRGDVPRSKVVAQMIKYALEAGYEVNKGIWGGG